MTSLSFHLGAHRTASTSLQRHLRAARDDDPTLSVALRDEPWSCDYRLLSRLTLPERWALPALNAALFEALLRARALPSCLISDENLLGKMLGQVPALYPRASRLAAALAELSRRGHEVRALIVVREPVSLIESCYRFRSGSDFRGDASAFVRTLRLETLRWVPVLEPFRAALGAGLTVLPYELLAQRPARFGAELSRFHPAFLGFTAEDRHNAGAPPAWLAVAAGARAAGIELPTWAFRLGGQRFAAHPELGRERPSLELAALVTEARRALRDGQTVLAGLDDQVLGAGLARWRGRVAREHAIDPATALHIRELVGDEWDELFARFMPDCDPALWRAVDAGAASRAG